MVSKFITDKIRTFSKQQIFMRKVPHPKNENSVHRFENFEFAVYSESVSLYVNPAVLFIEYLKSKNIKSLQENPCMTEGSLHTRCQEFSEAYSINIHKVILEFRKLKKGEIIKYDSSSDKSNMKMSRGDLKMYYWNYSIFF